MSQLYTCLFGDRTASLFSKQKWALPTQDGEPGEWVEALPGTFLAGTDAPYQVFYKWGADVWAIEGDKCVAVYPERSCFHRARLLHKIANPAWLQRAIAFVDSIKGTPWFVPQIAPNPAWRMFWGKTAFEARELARMAFRNECGMQVERDKSTFEVWKAVVKPINSACRWAVYEMGQPNANAAVWNALATMVSDKKMRRVIATDAKETVQQMLLCLIASDMPEVQTHLEYMQQRWAVWQAGYGLFGDVEGAFYVYGVGE